MSDVLDLDALVPVAVTIKFDGNEIEVKPPKTGEVLRLGYLGQKLQDAQDMPVEKIDELVTNMTGLVYQCIPELNDSPLNTSQLLKLVEILSQMAMPPDAKELESRGVTAESPKAP